MTEADKENNENTNCAFTKKTIKVIYIVHSHNLVPFSFSDKIHYLLWDFLVFVNTEE